METVWVAIKNGKIYGVARDKKTMLKMINSYIDDNTSVSEVDNTIFAAGDIRAEEWIIAE